MISACNLRAAAVLALCCATAGCASSRDLPPKAISPSHPPMRVMKVEIRGARTGLVRPIIGAPEEMMDAHILGAGDFGEREARRLEGTIRGMAEEYGFGGDLSKALALKLRIDTHLARIGEIWPCAEYLVEAEYRLEGPGGDTLFAETVNMYYSTGFFWSIDSLRRDVEKCLAHKLLQDISRLLSREPGEKTASYGNAEFLPTSEGARGEFFGE